MSFAAEPYGVFVDDLVTGLTGGITREEFVFITHSEDYRLGFPGDFLANTVRIHGLVEGEYFRFHTDVDFKMKDDGTIEWLATAGPEAAPRAGAHWPDRGTHFYASYERKPEVRATPVLTDRNPGSVLRTLAESFAREYAVMSKQLDRVYDAAFLDSAEGRDLDQVAALVGVLRRTRSFARGEVVFSRSTPADADIFIRAGTLVTTGDAPAITVETIEARTLRAGTVSVSAPVQAQTSGPDGVAQAGTLTVIHRPILGIESASNPTALSFGGGNETDETLRSRARRALETSGRSTVTAIIGALLSIDGVREEDIRITEDHVAFPGTVKLTIASELDEARQRRAVELINEYRPAGVRMLHNLPVSPAPSVPPSTSPGGSPPGPTPGPTTPAATGATTFDIGVIAAVTPASAGLTATQKANLKAKVESAIKAVVGRAGIGEHVIYNQIVAASMGVEGVYDVTVDLFAIANPPSSTVRTGRQNLFPPSPGVKAKLDATNLDVRIRGALIALDVGVDVQLLGIAESMDPDSAIALVRDEIVATLTAFSAGATGTVTKELLRSRLGSANYNAVELRYSAELMDEGLRIVKADVEIELAPEQQLWIRTVNVVSRAS